MRLLGNMEDEILVPCRYDLTPHTCQLPLSSSISLCHTHLSSTHTLWQLTQHPSVMLPLQLQLKECKAYLLLCLAAGVICKLFLSCHSCSHLQLTAI